MRRKKDKESAEHGLDRTEALRLEHGRGKHKKGERKSKKSSRKGGRY